MVEGLSGLLLMLSFVLCLYSSPLFFFSSSSSSSASSLPLPLALALLLPLLFLLV